MNVKLSLTEQEAGELSRLLNYLLETTDSAEESLMSVCNKTDDALKNRPASDWTRVDSIEELPKDCPLLIEYQDDFGVISHIVGWYEQDEYSGNLGIRLEYTDEFIDITPMAYMEITPLS